MRLERADIKNVEKDGRDSLKFERARGDGIDIRSPLSRRRFSSRKVLEGQFWLLRRRSHQVVRRMRRGYVDRQLESDRP